MTFFKSVCEYFSSVCNKDLGFYGNDTPSKLIEYVLKNIKKRESLVEAFIINGDFVEHGIAQSNSSGDFD